MRVDLYDVAADGTETQTAANVDLRDCFPGEMIATLIRLPSIERPARIRAGMVFGYGGRMLRVHRVYPGDDAACPVIVEELSDFGPGLKGQFAIWSAGGVMRAMGGAR